MLGFSQLLPRAAVCAALLLLATVASAAESDVRRIWQILDYLAVDYRGAVKDGAVLNASEFAEMREFAKASQTKLAALDPHPEQPALVTEAGALAAAIDAREDPARVAMLAKSLGNHLLAVYPVSSSPSAPPNVAAAAAIYQAQCAACHGATGNGDGPLGVRLEPRPVAFTDQARARERSVFALYQVISQGIEGTPMVSFASLPEADRWALAFYIGQFAHKQEDVAAGETAWKDNAAVRAQLTNLDGLARTTEADLAKEVGPGPAAVAMAYLHAHPEAVVQKRPLTFDIARQRLAQSEEAYDKNDFKRAADLALSAYLDGVEPLEPTLATRDKALLGRIETAMSQFRSLLASRASSQDVKAQTLRIDALFKEADSVLSTAADDSTAAFLGSFTILLREGLEALLVVVAMVAFLRKAERPDMLQYVHAGWVGALALGAVTWAVATYIVNVSGASREVTEGLSSLFAAAVLLSVGMWMHQKSMAGKWQHYIHEKLSAALNRKSAFFMFSLSFIAVYREVFETILFYAALWEQGNHAAVLGGLAAGLVVLVAVAFALLKFSARLPIGKFFSWSSMLVAVLAVVLTGKGVAALQEAGWIGALAINTPRIDILGIFPSAQSLGAQLGVAALIILGFAMNARAARGTS
ncbi:cytochrome c/FTR1 family iron permease [Variovorax sp. YR216]|uniref:cytochrome c/FTR1 family iron permease n=1 Tax=Variovorax sp. YR216 TaxID=1882828 RepID=UPI000ACA7833|nr:FTR1 family protein [Variovorax sp. YR216]